MYEAVAQICAVLAGVETCGPVLVPGYEAATETACEALAAAGPKGRSLRCVPAGPAAEVQEIVPGVFVHFGTIAEPDGDNRGDVANLGFVIGERSVAVIDAGSSRAVAAELWRAIRARTDLPVSHLVLTHMHPDHVLGATLFAEAGAGIVGHDRLARALADRVGNYRQSLATLIGPGNFLGSDVAPVDRPVAATDQIDLGARHLSLRAWPSAHTGTDISVMVDDGAVLFAGDLVFADHAPALDGSITGWQGVLVELQAMPARHMVPGHGETVMNWPEGAADLTRYLEVLAQDTRAAIAQGLSLAEAVPGIARSEAPHWQLFEAYNPRNATVAFTELEWE